MTDKIGNIIYSIITIGIILICGSMIKREIETSYPKVYRDAMKNAPWYIKVGNKLC